MDSLKYFHEHVDGVAFTNEITYKYFNMQFAPLRRLTYTKDRMSIHIPVIYFHKPSILRDSFNKELQKYREAGLTDIWIRKFIDVRKMQISNMPLKLQIESVITIYQIIAIAYVISSMVFLLEVVSAKFMCKNCILDYLTY